jgi:hypothetical protein
MDDLPEKRAAKVIITVYFVGMALLIALLIGQSIENERDSQQAARSAAQNP